MTTYTVTQEAPILAKRPAGTGREKSALRTTLEGMEIGDWLDTGEDASDEKARNRISGLVQRTGKPLGFSYRIKAAAPDADATATLWVTRVAPKAPTKAKAPVKSATAASAVSSAPAPAPAPQPALSGAV